MSERRLARGETLVIATHNPGKVREIRDILVPYAVEAVSAGTLGLPEPEETGATFAANAEIKARAAAIASGLPALADDSGLCVAALDGAPGVYSARWAGPQKDFSTAIQRVLDETEGHQNPRAWFTCALTLAWPDGPVVTVEGQVDGVLTAPRGDRGFGYDPIFIPRGETETFGEMAPERKHAMSHRARAFALLVECAFTPA